MREQPEQQAPPVQRLRLRYIKRGRLRFTSHRDFSRAFERAVARAGLPIALSSGFNPHPRISYAGAAPTGAASEAEYVEIAMREVVDPAAALARLREVLPEELTVVEVAESPGGSLSDLLQASTWVITLPASYDVVAPAVERFLGAAEVTVQRMTKRGLRSFDCRGAVLALNAVPEGAGTRLDLTLKHVEPAVRPDDVVSGLDLEDGLLPLYQRLTQGPLDDASGSIGDPLHPAN